MAQINDIYCRWCGDRPGGCLYCRGEEASIAPAELSSEETARLFGRDMMELQRRVAAGQVRIVAIHKEGVALELDYRPPKRVVEPPKRAIEPCRVHLWAFDRGNFKRRYCTRPGCWAVQRWEWLPGDSGRNGQWVEIMKRMDANKIKNVVARVKRALKQRRTYLWAGCHGTEGRMTIEECQMIAEKAGSDWLYNEATGEAKFFEGN